jgi:hypothetical protein
LKRDALFRVRATVGLVGTVWTLFDRNHARDYHVIAHALSPIRVTRRLPSRRFLHTARIWWYKRDNIHV